MSNFLLYNNGLITLMFGGQRLNITGSPVMFPSDTDLFHKIMLLIAIHRVVHVCATVFMKQHYKTIIVVHEYLFICNIYIAHYSQFNVL